MAAATTAPGPIRYYYSIKTSMVTSMLFFVIVEQSVYMSRYILSWSVEPLEHCLTYGSIPSMLHEGLKKRKSKRKKNLHPLSRKLKPTMSGLGSLDKPVRERPRPTQADERAKALGGVGVVTELADLKESPRTNTTTLLLPTHWAPGGLERINFLLSTESGCFGRSKLYPSQNAQPSTSCLLNHTGLFPTL